METGLTEVNRSLAGDGGKDQRPGPDGESGCSIWLLLLVALHAAFVLADARSRRSWAGYAASGESRSLDEQHLPIRRQRPQVVGDHRFQLVAAVRTAFIAGITLSREYLAWSINSPSA